MIPYKFINNKEGVLTRFTFQVRAFRASRLWAFHFNRERGNNKKQKISFYKINILHLLIQTLNLKMYGNQFKKNLQR